MDEMNSVSKEYAILCKETSETIDYLDGLVNRLKQALNDAEEAYIKRGNTMKIATRKNIQCVAWSKRARSVVR